MTAVKFIAFKIPFNLPFSKLSPSHPLNQKSQILINDHNWIKHRIELFMTYTLPSLTNQTNQNFMAYILCYKPTLAYIQTILSNFSALPSNIQFIAAEDYDTFITKYIQDSTFFYEVEMGSDDLYHKHFIQYLYDYTPNPTTQFLICQNGYIFSSTLNKLAEYFNFSSCFNALVYSTSDYLKGTRYIYAGFIGAIRLPHELIPWRAYINHSHDANIAFSYELEDTTHWGKDKAYIGNVISSSEELTQIFLDFMGKMPPTLSNS